MKKILLVGLVLLIFSLTVEPASAWYKQRFHPRGRSHHRAFIGPPVILLPPPPPPARYYYYRSYPPRDYYDYYERGYRVWVPGHWEHRRTPYGWKRVWIRGHWEWR